MSRILLALIYTLHAAHLKLPLSQKSIREGEDTLRHFSVSDDPDPLQLGSILFFGFGQ